MSKKIFIVILTIIGVVVIYSSLSNDPTNKFAASSLTIDHNSYHLINKHKETLSARYITYKDTLTKPTTPEAMAYAFTTIGNTNHDIANPHTKTTPESASQIVVNDNNNYAPYQTSESRLIVYISEFDSNQITSCSERLDHSFACHVAISGLAGPENILVLNSKLYILNLNNSTLTICNINNYGSINNCNSVMLPLLTPVYLYYSNQQLFISDFGVKKTIACPLDGAGNIAATCTSVNELSAQSFKNATYNEFSYATDYTNNAINKCNILLNKPCTKIKDGAINGPLTIAIFNHTVYIANTTVFSVTQCNIQANGDFSNCKIITNQLQMPIGVAEYYTKPSL